MAVLFALISHCTFTEASLGKEVLELASFQNHLLFRSQLCRKKMNIPLMMKLILLLSVGVYVQSAYGTQDAFEKLYKNTTKAVEEVAYVFSSNFQPSSLCNAAYNCDIESCIPHSCGGNTFKDSEYICNEKLDFPGLETCKEDCQNKKRLLSLSEPFIVTPPRTMYYEGESSKPAGEMKLIDQRLTADACALKQTKEHFRNSFETYDLKNWIYGSSKEGVLAVFPGSAWPIAPDSDSDSDSDSEECGITPMQRPWYITAATGKKDVVFLLDTSLEKSGRSRMALRHALKILDPRDFVSVISFSQNSPEILGSEDKMMVASKSNIDQLITGIEGLPTSTGHPVVRDAFESAFDVIRKSKEAKQWTECQKSTIIVLLLGKAPDCFSQCEKSCTCTEKIVEKVKDLQKKHRTKFGTDVTIVSFTEGGDPDAERVAKSLVCEKESNGVWQRISPENPWLSSVGDITSMASYSKEPKAYASAIYDDANGLGKVFTVARAVNDKEHRRFVGVVGADITVAQVEKLVGKENAEAVIGKKNSEERHCTEFSTLEPCDLRSIRGGFESAHCAGRVPRKPSMCYKLSNRLFWRIENPSTWEEARQTCKSFGGDLAKADTPEALEYLSGLVSYDGSWVGMKGDIRKWVDGTDLSVDLFGPGIDEEDFDDACVSLDRRGIRQNGNVLRCGVLRDAVCEMSAGSKAAQAHCSDMFDLTADPESNNCEENDRQQCDRKADDALAKATPLCPDALPGLLDEDSSDSERFCCGGKAGVGDTCNNVDRDPERPKRGLSTGAIVGIAIGAVVALIACVYIVRRVIILRSDSIAPSPLDTVENGAKAASEA